MFNHGSFNLLQVVGGCLVFLGFAFLAYEICEYIIDMATKSMFNIPGDW